MSVLEKWRMDWLGQWKSRTLLLPLHHSPCIFVSTGSVFNHEPQMWLSAFPWSHKDTFAEGWCVEMLWGCAERCCHSGGAFGAIGEVSLPQDCWLLLEWSKEWNGFKFLLVSDHWELNWAGTLFPSVFCAGFLLPMCCHCGHLCPFGMC